MLGCVAVFIDMHAPFSIIEVPETAFFKLYKTCLKVFQNTQLHGFDHRYIVASWKHGTVVAIAIN